MRRSISLLLIMIILLSYSCEDVFQYSPNEVRPHAKDINAKNIARISADDDTLRFIMIADIHHAYEELEGFVDAINNTGGISFVLVAGDHTNFGLQYEYDEVHEKLDRLSVPYIAGNGNHDLLANGIKVFEQMYGPLNFSFRVKENKFVFINTCSREYNFNGAVPDINYLKNELADTNSYTNAIVIGHVPPFDSDFDSKLESAFNNTLVSGNAKASLYGHQHTYQLSDYYQNGIDCLVADDLKDRKYVLIKIYGSEILFEEKSF